MTGFETLCMVAGRSLICVTLTLAMLVAMRSRPAAEQSALASGGLLLQLLLPVAALILPSVPLALPVPDFWLPPAQSLAPVAVDLHGAAAARMNWAPIVLVLYLLPAAASLSLFVVALRRLGAIRSRATVMTDRHWLEALNEARRALGYNVSPLLMISSEIDSPISCGARRPTIIVDPATAANAGWARAVVAHELAHIVRRDWLRLVAARIAVAIFWFNPLVWLLSRRARRLCEEAADDLALRGGIDRSAYAALLVDALRRTDRHLRLTNGMAQSRSAISCRVEHVLGASLSDPTAAAVIRGRLWLALALVCGGALAVLRPQVAMPVMPDIATTVMTSPAATSMAPSALSDPAPAPQVRASRRVSVSRPIPNLAAVRVSKPVGTTLVDVAGERRAQGESWRERGAAWSERGEAWSERGREWRERGETWRAEAQSR